MPTSLGFYALTPSFLQHKATARLDSKETYGLARLLAKVEKRDVSNEQTRPSWLLAQNVLKHLLAMADAATAAAAASAGAAEDGGGLDDGGGVGSSAPSTPHAVSMSQAEVEAFLSSKSSSRSFSFGGAGGDDEGEGGRRTPPPPRPPSSSNC